MCNPIVFCSWASQIVLEWLHPGCDGDLSANFLNFGAGDFPIQSLSKTISKSWFEAAILGAVVRSSIVFCNWVFADRIVMAGSRFLGATAACVILFFAAGHRKSYWNGCIQVAMLLCQQIFSILALVIFLLKKVSQ